MKRCARGEDAPAADSHAEAEVDADSGSKQDHHDGVPTKKEGERNNSENNCFFERGVVGRTNEENHEGEYEDTCDCVVRHGD